MLPMNREAPTNPDNTNRVEPSCLPSETLPSHGQTEDAAEHGGRLKDADAVSAPGESNLTFSSDAPPSAPDQASETADEKLVSGDPTDASLTTPSEIKAALEALLFVTTEPLSVSRLAKILAGPTPSQIHSLLLELQAEYDGSLRGMQIVEVAGGFQMATRPQFAEWIYRLKPSRRRNPLSQATLETLAIIAYKQPITRAEVEAIRGVDSSGTIHTLMELGLVDVGGRREVPGRPQLYVTTAQFLKVFGLRSLGDLPSIQELRRMFAAASERHPSSEIAADGPKAPASPPAGAPPATPAGEPAEQDARDDTCSPL